MKHFASAVLALVAADMVGLCLHAQQVGIYLSATFDSPSGSAYAYATTTLDYSASYYYSVCTSIGAIAEEDSGAEQGYESNQTCDATNAAVSWSFGIPTDTDYMNFNGTHQEFVDYNAYQFDSNYGSDGYDCYGYWDADEMSFMGINGQTYGSSIYWYLPGPPPASIAQNSLSELTHQELGSGFCYFPRWETSTYTDMEVASQTGYYGGIFSMQLDNFNGFANFSGRRVSESFGPVSSTCWFPLSPFAQLSVGSFNASTWPVAGNTYSPDYIGWNVPEGNYYQNQLNGSGSCTMFSDSQIMSISQCQNGNLFRIYDYGHTNSFNIYPSTMFASRAAATGRAQ
jgi:hypothetical protein